MVSLRRRRLLGLCSGRNCLLVPLLKSCNGTTINESNRNYSKAVVVHPLPSEDEKQLYEEPVMGIVSESSNGSGSSPLASPQDQPFQEPAVKRRKPHRRKNRQNQLEPCLMRGVYFKNMKWQAAIKVDKKQIHLGTVGSQVEAAHLYDRAAFMCGREPNFELAKDEKRQLRKLNWDEFLAMTRNTITNKKQRGRIRAGSGKGFELVTEDGNRGGNDLSTSDDDAAMADS
ncbi:hypothetical protein MLD38_012410 [Melastoma candidum]|uniref:Uncharacterized protein n=1 Tax=Melastoma candidum TaxID=119954 RepID=A0ACB9R694_9MYRT|nr:hypothetical protein MLD38_012410 [Melastoma candidum]